MFKSISNKIYYYLVFFGLLFSFQNGFGQVASATWALTSNANSSVTGNVTATSGTISGVTATTTVYDATNGRGAYNWPTADAISTTKYYQFTVSPTAGNSLNVSSISLYTYEPSSYGLHAAVYYSTDGFATSTQAGSQISVSTTSNQTTIGSLNISVPSGSTLSLRVYFYWAFDVTSSYASRLKNVVISGTTSASCTQPTTQATIGAYTNNTTGNSVTANWTRGNGTGGIIAVARLTATTAVAPTSGTSYTANAAFGSGNTTGTGNYVVYNGTGTSVNITALTGGSAYTIDLYEYNTASTCYKTPASSGAVTIIKIEPTNQVTNFLAGTVTTTSIPLTWTAAAAGSQLPDGYLVKLSTVDLATIANPADGTDPADVTAITANAANKKQTTGTATSTTSFTGMTAGTMYYYKNFSYTNTGTSINFNTTSAPTLYHATLPAVVTSQTITPTSSGTANITWSLPGSYVAGNHTTLVFVKATSSVTAGTPTSNPTTYTANTAFNAGTAYQGDAAAYCVYNGDGTSVSITGLSANTTYHIAVYTVVSAANSNSTNSYSAVATANGTTPCAAITSLPHTEPFTSYLPSTCWMEGDAGDITAGPTTISSSASTWGADDFLNSTGTYIGAAKINIDATGDNDWIISPQFTLPATPNQRLKYSVGATQFGTTTAPTTAWEADDYVQVLISTTAYTTWSVLKTYDNTNTPSHLGQTDILDLSAYAGQTIRIAYRGVEGATNGSADIDFFVDNFVIETIPTCIEPTGVTSSAITPTTATISWAAAVPAPGSGYQYEIRTSGAALSGATGLTTSGTTAAGVVTANITGLSGNTTYYVYVRSDCGSSDYSAWTSSYSFTTLKIEPTNQPTNFAAGAFTTTTIPLTWTAAAAGSQLPDGYLVKLSTVDLSTIANPVDGTDPADVTAITSNAANKKQTTGTSTSTTSFTGMTEGTMYYYKIFSYTNSGTGINFNTTTTTAQTLNHATKPIAVTSTSLTPTSSGTANITWSNSGYVGANWQTLVFVKAASSITTGTPTNNPTSYTANTALGSGTAYQNDAAAYCVYNGDGTSVSITGLSATTTYYVAVYTVVSAVNSITTNSYSSVSTTSATTPCALYPLTFTQDFNASTSTPACWSTDMSVTAAHGNTTTNGLNINLWSSTTTCYARTPQVGPLTTSSRVTFDYRIVDFTSYPATATTLGASDKIEVKVSTDDVTYTTIYTINSTTHTSSLSFANKQLPLGSYSGSNVYVKFVGTWGAGDYYLDIDNVVIENSVAPIVSVGPVTAYGNQCINTTSSEKSYTVSGANLTNNIILTPPANFEISLTSGSGFVANPSTITLTQTGGNVANTTIYTRFKPTAVQAYSGNITHTSTGATNQNVALSGSGVNSSPTISTPTSASVTSTTAVLGGNITATGCSNITERGIYWSTTSGFADGAGTKVSETAGAPYSTGVFTINVSSLTPETVYYYKVFATNAAGSVYTTQGTFTTQCAAFNPPYTQDFAIYIPSCWYEATGSLAPTTTLTTGSTDWEEDGFANSSSSGATSLNIYSTGLNSWLVSPAVNLVSGNTYQLEFDLALTAFGSTSTAEIDGIDDKFAVVISTDGGATWSNANTLMLWDNDNSTNASNNRVYNDISNTSTRIVIPLSSYTGQTIRIGFYGESTISNADNDLFIDNFVIQAVAIPNCATQTAPANAATDICPGGGATLTWTKAATGCTASNFIMYFGTNNPPTNIVNGASIGDVTSYNTGALVGNTTYYWKVQPSSSVGTNTSCTNVFSFTTYNVSTPTVTSPVSTCSNTATLSATGSSLYWYDVPSGGTSIGTGNTYNATFNGNTTYYVASQSGASGSNYSAGLATKSAQSTFYASSSMGLTFTTIQALTLNSVDVYVQTAGTDVTVQLFDASDVAIGSSQTFTSLSAGLNTLSLNLNIATPGDYILKSTSAVNLAHESTSDGATVSYPQTVAGVISISSGYWWGADAGYYGYFYNWKITTGGVSCQSARVPIVVNHTAEEIIITPSGPTTFDQGGSVDLTASSTHTPAYSFTWVPTAGLNTTTGANVTATPSISTTYTVTGNNGSCTRSATIDISVILPCTGLGTGVTSISSLPYSISGQTTTGKVDDITSLNATVCSSSSYYEDPDVVYIFKPLVSGSVTITLTSGSTYSGLMLYKGCPMNGQGGVCASSSQSSTGDKSMCVNVEANENYYLVIDSYNSSNYIDYALSISAPNPGSTPNDLPCDAAPVSLGGIVSGDNSCASGTGEPTTPSCWSSSGSINTLWYSIVAPASGKLKIRTLLGSLTNTQIALYQGTCNSLSLVTNGCNDDFTLCSITSDQSDLSLTGLTAGATYYLAVDGYGDEIGTFSVMAIDGDNNWAAVPQQDCSSATVVCNVSTDVGNPGFVGSGNICDFSSSYGCLSSGEKNSAWYTINILSNGVFTFVITPVNSSTDYDWGLFNVTGISNPCSVINANTTTPLVRCSYAATGGATGLNATSVDQSEGSGGDKWCQQLSVTAGDVLMLNISNYSSNNSGFNLNMEASPVNYNQPTSVTWTGATDTDWFKPANWGGCAIPSCTIDAVIVNGPMNQPVINAAGAACKSLQVINGATLTINAGRNLQMCGNFENLGVLNIDPTASITMDNGSTVQALNGSLTGTNKLGNLVVNKTGGEVTANQNVEIGGNLTTSSATSIFNTNGKAIIVGGNVVLNSPSTYTNIGTGSLEFNGASAQSYSPNGSLTLNNVEMHNSSTGVTLNSDLTLGTGGTLLLNSGVIHTGSNKVTLLNTDPDATNIGSATSYINGNLRRHLLSNTGVYAFPVGNATAYRLAQLTNNSMVGVTYIDGKFSSSFTNTGSLNSSIAIDFGTPYSSFASEGIWTLTPNAQPSGGSYGINLWFNGGGSNSFSGLIDNAFGPLKRSEGQTVATVWSSQGGSLETTAGRLVADGYARRDGWSSFSEFGIGKAVGALPVTLLSAHLNCVNDHKVITWTTASEINNDYFTILSSNNAINFTEIAQINGAGNSNTTLNYQWIDTTASANEAIYYQLQQTDNNGVSKTISLFSGVCDIQSNNDIIIISNPSNPNIEARFTGDVSGKYSISVVNYLGQVVLNKEINLEKDGNVVFLPKKGLATGIYNLVFKNKTEVITKQVLVSY